jgi:hypothetical protein
MKDYSNGQRVNEHAAFFGVAERQLARIGEQSAMPSL